MRSTAREIVFKYIFSKLFNPDDEGLFTVMLKGAKLSEDKELFATDLYNAVINNFDAYLEKIESITPSYRSDRIFAADKCAIMIGMAEFDNFKETPVPVIINEAVNLSAKFSTEKSTDFVNGVLAEYVKTER